MNKKIINSILNLFFFFAITFLYAQEVRVIDNKGTLKTINRVTSGAEPTEKTEGDTWFDTTNNEIKIWDNDSDGSGTPGWRKINSNTSHTGTPGSVFFAGADGTPTEKNNQFFWNNTTNRLHLGNPLSGNNKLTVNGQVRARNFNVADGTQNNPSFRFANDLKTGMFKSGTNQIGFSTNEIKRLNISNSEVEITNNLSLKGSYKDSSGDEGTDGQILSSTTISGVKGTNWIDNPTSNNWLLTGNTGTTPSTNFLGTIDAQDLVLKTNDTEAIRILQNNQYVGMGLNTPTSPLHIKRDLPDTVGLLRLEGTEPDINFNDTNGGFNTFTFENNGQGRVLIGRDADDNFYISRRVGTNLWQDQTFRILNSNGNVGININRLDATDNVPSEKLDVNGKLRVRDVSEVTNLSVGDKIVIIDANGVVKKIAGSFHTVGDIKYSVQDNDHDGWYKLDGRANTDVTLTSDAQSNASSLFPSGNLPDATDRVLKHPNGVQTVGDIGGQTNTTLSKANIPNYDLPQATTSSDGEHQHNVTGVYDRQPIINNRDSRARFLTNDFSGSVNTSSDGNHTHTVTVNSGGSNQAFERYQPYLVVNTFIYLGN